MKLHSLVILALGGGAAAAACGTGASSGVAEENTGRAIARLSQVPAGVSCVEIDVAGARTVTSRFDVTTNQAVALSLTGLPLGNDTFTGLAYPDACSKVTAASQATWISPGTPVTLTARIVANVSLALVPNGQANVVIGFNPDDAGAATDATSTEAGNGADAGATDLSWAQWRMPNSPQDVALGAPNVQSYSLNADGNVVIDNVTGLMWQRTPTGSDGGTYPTTSGGAGAGSAAAYCANLAASSFAGYADWRLPTAIELISIADYGTAYPALNTTYFPGAPTSPSNSVVTHLFWSATPVVGIAAPGEWAVSSETGNLVSTFETSASYVRCARGGAGPFTSAPTPTPAGRYTYPSPGVVYDTATRLTWQGTPPTVGNEVDRTRAWSTCRGLTLNGTTGWRLPTLGELATLIEFWQGPDLQTIDSTAFPSTPFDFGFWSYTQLPGQSAQNGRGIIFGSVGGLSALEGTTGGNELYVRCVHD